MECIDLNTPLPTNATPLPTNAARSRLSLNPDWLDALSTCCSRMAFRWNS